MSERATVIDWYGPIRLKKVWKVAEANGWSEGIVMALGLHRPLFYAVRQRPVQYICITQVRDGRPDDETRRKLRRLSSLASRVWIGVPKGHLAEDDLDADRPPHPKDLKSAEEGLAYFLKSRLNRRALGDSFMVLNRWFDYRDGSTRKRPHSHWPDIIDYDRAKSFARLVWVDRNGQHLTIRRYDRDFGAAEKGLLERLAPRWFEREPARPDIHFAK